LLELFAVRARPALGVNVLAHDAPTLRGRELPELRELVLRVLAAVAGAYPCVEGGSHVLSSFSTKSSTTLRMSHPIGRSSRLLIFFRRSIVLLSSQIENRFNMR